MTTNRLDDYYKRSSDITKCTVGDVLAQLSDRERFMLVIKTSDMHLRALMEGASVATAMAMVAGHLAGVAYRLRLEEHDDHECHCDRFSDCYKSVTGIRPRWELDRNGGNWSCKRITQWFRENYRETRSGHFEPVVPFRD